MMPYNSAQVGTYNTQPMQQGYQQPQPQTQQLTMLTVFVPGEQGMRSYHPQPGQTVLLIDTGSMTAWVKWTDNSGAEFEDEYEMVKREPKPEPQYVTKDELERFKDEILEALTSDK